jgi:hypothetical protein
MSRKCRQIDVAARDNNKLPQLIPEAIICADSDIRSYTQYDIKYLWDKFHQKIEMVIKSFS